MLRLPRMFRTIETVTTGYIFFGLVSVALCKVR
jgi:hypothetical protein